LINSNTFREVAPKHLGLSKWFLAALAFVCLANFANALGSNKAISQYIRDQWGAEQGFPGGPVYAIAQTPDGYLWIGAEKGLVRFDGLSFHLFGRSDSAVLPAGPILGLAVDVDGNLWVRMQGPKFLRYREGIFRDVLADLKSPEADVTAMCVGKNGEILFSGLLNGTVRFSKGKFTSIVTVDQLPKLVISLAETSDGKVWLGTKDSGLYSVSDGQVRAVAGLSDRKINTLLATGSRELWVGTDSGVSRWNGSEFSEAGLPQGLNHLQSFAMIRDRDSNIWIGTSKGLMRVASRGDSSSEQDERGPANGVTSLFEDREGNLWVGSTRGIERLRDSVFTTYSVSRGLPGENNGPVYVDAESRTWFAPSEGGLYWLKEGRVGRVTDSGLDRDVVYSISGGKDGLWIGRQRGGLTHIRYRGNSFETETYTQANGLAQDSIFAVAENRDGTVWAGSLSGGLSEFKNGGFKTYKMADGIASNSVAAIEEGSDGTMWFGTPNGLSALSKGTWRNYTSADGLPPGNVSCLLEDSAGALWIGTANGLAYMSAGSIQAPRNISERLQEAIFGIEEDKNGSLWIATSNHILRVDRNKLKQGTLGGADVREYGLADGLLGMEGVKRDKSVVADSLGRIWISTNRGISVVDPRRMASDSVPALLHVEGISADGRAIHLGGGIRVAAPHQRITLRYEGLSLSVPERVRFKYKLDSFDAGWSEPTAAREASYTNLDSGTYLFRVVASNSDGVWNSAETTLQFEIEPVFWQTWWFRLICLLTLALAALTLVRLRLLQLTKQLNVRFEERLAERTRIAQELHDTLLQGFLSASMQLHVANDRLPADSPGKALIGRVLELMSRVIEEGRNVVQGLRASKRNIPDLEQAFSQIRQEFPVESQIEFRVIVEGAPRPLRVAIRDEVYLIGHEALSNAFRHSHASDIEVELEYAASHLRVFIRDNGVGIDAQVLRTGRERHWGLFGMKERTERIGGELKVLSRAVAGTEVELSVPGRLAYEPETEDHGSGGWLSKFYARKERNEESRARNERNR